MSNVDRPPSALQPLARVQLEAAECSAVTPLVVDCQPAWPTFTVTLTYHVETDDPARQDAAVRAFFQQGSWPLDSVLERAPAR